MRFFSPTLRLLAAWFVALALAGQRLDHARHCFDDERRPDGNRGHAFIDFGGQYVMGRMLLEGHGRHLYDRKTQWSLVRAIYPRADESEFVHRNAVPQIDPDVWHDDDDLMDAFMGRDPPAWGTAGRAIVMPLAADTPLAAMAQMSWADTRVTPAVVDEVNRNVLGGPLYPPVHAFVYAPIAMLGPPQRAYFGFQILAVMAAFLAGLGMGVLSRNRGKSSAIWWPVATAILLVYPGVRPALDLGQNPTLTLAILVWGWVLLARGSPVFGGMIWGLLAFKPVWGLAFFLVPVLLRQWRFCIAMVLTGCGLAAATVPIVGIESWLDWLQIGKIAADRYAVRESWIFLSRDLGGIPKRWLLDFTRPQEERFNPLANWLGRGLWLVIFATTVGVAWKRIKSGTSLTGIAAAFLVFGGYLTCYRFIYYDAAISFLGFAVLFARPARIATRIVPLCVLLWLLMFENWLLPLGRSYSALGMTFDPSVRYPWDTYAVAIVWVWCGLMLLIVRLRKPSLMRL